MTASEIPSPKNKARPSDFRWLVGSTFNLIKKFGHQLIWAALLGYLGHQTAVVFVAFAGKASNADLAVRIAANLNVAVTISLAVTGLSIGLYLRERKLHRATRERLTARITTLERRVDPTRTSSRLTREGLTRKEDT
jgi:hypothetical protein